MSNNRGIVQRRKGGLGTLWILKIYDVELDDLSVHVPHTDEYRVFLWFEANEKSRMMTGPSKSEPKPTWNEEFFVRSYDRIQHYEYLNLEVIKVAKEPGTSHGYGAVAKTRVRLPKYYGKRSGRFILVSTEGSCESTVGVNSVGFISLGMERRKLWG